MSIRKKILFITIVRIDSIEESGHTSDLISKLSSEGYDITVICPIERRFGLRSRIINSNGVKIIQVKSLNIQKANILEKMISTFFIEFLFIGAFLRNCKNQTFDLGIFTTPPIFTTNFIKFIGKKNIKVKYLLLRDIFPQNALDLNMTKKYSPFYLYSRLIEKKLYKIVDFIGCMSNANLDYILTHNNIDKSKLEIIPDSIDISKYPGKEIEIEKNELKLIYGGNLGVPQNPELIAEFITKIELLNNISFKIIGSGTKFKFLEDYIISKKIRKTKILAQLPKAEYFKELQAADIGLIFLNERFTIPNYPSRMLDYLYFDLAIISNTDINTDITDFIKKAKVGCCFYGFKDLEKMISEIKKLKQNPSYLKSFSCNSFKSLTTNFNVDISSERIIRRLN
ncbi:MAG: glycosyltransferase family 4 protein [Schleiferiaceae bacterium]|nr:glycosyltransferase family 4 protein [Schleiferiaceae bacterium]